MSAIEIRTWMPYHNHPGTNLVIGCPGCIAVVQRDQRNAAWRDAPIRTCTWRFHTPSGKRLSFTLDVRVPAGVEEWEVDEWYADATGPEITIALTDAGFSPDTVAECFHLACETIECTDIGAIVPETVEPVQHPTLFGGAA